jgi:hypothetical protein
MLLFDAYGQTTAMLGVAGGLDVLSPSAPPKSPSLKLTRY